MSPIVQNTDATKTLTDIENNLDRLTLDIPDATIDDLPLHYQRHTVGVPGPISCLLR